jgi:LysM repeat protein
MQLMKYLKNYKLLSIIFFVFLSISSFSQEDETLIYITQKDESIFKIAERFNIDYHLIMIENSLKEHFVKKGKELKIKGLKVLPYKEKFIYEVKPNEDINKIAKKFSLNPKTIMLDNNIKNPYLLVIGKKLILENDIKPKSYNKITINPIIKKEIYHIAKKGESLYSISEKYNKSFSEILYLNKNIKNLFSNQKVLIDRYYKLNTNFNGIILNVPEKTLYIVNGEKFKHYNVLSYHNNLELYKEYSIKYKIENPDKNIDGNIFSKINVLNKKDLYSKLGAFWIGIDWLGNGIHCTNGKKSEEFSILNKTIKISCKDAYEVFSLVNLNEKFIAINEPIKLFIDNDNIFLEVYSDINNEYDYEYNIKKLTSNFKKIKINQEKVKQLILTKTGKREKINL